MKAVKVELVRKANEEVTREERASESSKKALIKRTQGKAARFLVGCEEEVGLAVLELFPEEV